MQKIFPDIRVLSFVESQLSSLPPYKCEVICECIFLHFLIENTTFTARLTERYPLHAPHIILLKSALVPSLSDSRDFWCEVIRQPWSPKESIRSVIDGLPSLLHRLNVLSEDCLAMQKVGRFHLGEKYSRKELESYSGLLIMENKIGGMVGGMVGGIIGISESHLLTYKPEGRRGRARSVTHPTNTNCSQTINNIEYIHNHPQYILAEWCHLQCVDKILISQKEIKVFFKKYRKIKEYYEAQIFIKIYVFEKPQPFLRSLFKAIPRLQNVEIGLRPSKKHKKEQLIVAQKIAECHKMETHLKNDQQEDKRRNILKQLNNLYQFLIEYYSARANPYYLIFINSLNKIHLLMKEKQ